MRIKINWILLIPLLFLACEEKFDPGIVEYENLLVVDGLMHNGTGPYTVKLSYSTAVSDPQFLPVTGCTVMINDHYGNTTPLTESEPGIYTTAESKLRGETGVDYKLNIQTPEGKHYESDWEMIRPSVGIDTIYTQYEYRSDPDISHTIEGYQFFISSETAEADFYGT